MGAGYGTGAGAVAVRGSSVTQGGSCTDVQAVNKSSGVIRAAKARHL